MGQKTSTKTKLELLTSTTWTTCANVDSLNQFYKMQFIPKEIADSLSYCTGNGCATADWTFKLNDGEQVFKEVNTMNCPEDVIAGMNGRNWYWRFDDKTDLIYVFDLDGSEQYHFKVASITENRLFIYTYKAE